MKPSLQASLTLLFAAFLATGCTSPEADEPSESASPQSVTTSQPTIGPTERPAPTEPSASSEPQEDLSPGEDFRVRCGTGTSRTSAHDSLEELWESVEENEREHCEVRFGADDFAEYELSEAETQVLENQNREVDLEVETLLTNLYERCADAYMGGLHGGDTRWYPFDIDSAEAAFALCPDQPEREEIEATFEQVLEDNSEMIERDAATERGDRVRGGDHLVGEGITPGTWVAESEEGFDGCYWERLDYAGNIVANNFMTSGFRAEVTILESDYSFSSTQCGEWSRQ